MCSARTVVRVPCHGWIWADIVARKGRPPLAQVRTLSAAGPHFCPGPATVFGLLCILASPVPNKNTDRRRKSHRPGTMRYQTLFGAFFCPQKQEKPPLSAFRRGFCQNNGGETEIPSLRSGISYAPAGPLKLGMASRAFGPQVLYVGRPLRKQAFDGPDYKKAPQQSCDAILQFAERPRFELGIPFWSIHAFQACLLSHSSISPDLSPEKTGLQR